MENIPVEKRSKKSPWTKVWISLGVLLFVIVGVSVFEYFRITPNNVYFTNVTSNSITVSWNTKRATSASVLVTQGEKKIPVSVVLKGDRYFDTRDVTNAELEAVEQTAENVSEDDSLTTNMDNFQTEVVVTDRGKYYTHHVTVTNLDPETEYSFLVGDQYIYRSVTDVNDLSVAKTLEVPDSVKSPVPAYGSVKDANNQEDLTVDELISVSDGVIYFNYFDTITNQRSNIFSSVLNKDGNWYIDLSLAMDSEGSPFMDTYDTIDGNIKVEYILDSGSMGIWKETQDAYTLTPAQDIVLNIPNAVQDANVEGSLVLLDNPLIESDVKGVTIMSIFTPSPSSEEESSCSCRCPSGSSTLKPSGSYTTLIGQCTDSGSGCVAPTCYKPKTSTTNNTTDTNTNNSTETNTTTQEKCLFTEFCPKNVNDCLTEITRKACACPQEKLDERNCSTGGVSVPEDLTCAGGYKQGAPAYDGTKCVVCGYTTNNNYFVARWEDSNGSYQYIDGECTPVGTPTCGVANGKIYPIDTTGYIDINDLCGSSSISDSGIVSFDENGYASWKCEFNNETVNCSATKVITEGNQNPVTCSLGNIGESCGDGKICGEESRCVSVGESCWGSTAGRMGAKSAIYNIYGMCSIVTCLDGYSIDERSCSVGFGCTQCSKDTTTKSVIYGPNCNSSNIGDKCVKSYQTAESSNMVCSSNNSCVPVGGNCSYSTIGKWSESGQCIPYTSDELCWTSISILYRGDGEDREKCTNGVWTSSPVEEDTNWCKSGSPCSSLSSKCVNASGEIYTCSYISKGEYNWKSVDPNPEYFAFETDLIGSGVKCGSAKCRCTGGVDKGDYINKGEWCREVRANISNVCKDKFKPQGGEVCARDGSTCLLEEDFNGVDYYFCTGDPKEASIQYENPLISYSNFTGEVLGQETSSYVIDEETGFFAEIEQGSYTFEYNGVNYFFEVIGSGSENVLIYIDENENGEYDEDLDLSISDIASTVEIIQIEKIYPYNLTAGFNFVSFPFLISNEEYRTAAGLLQKLNEVYGDVIYSISTFDGGKWKMVGQNVEVYDNNDFQLLPGVGYMIKAKEDVDISIVGQPIQYESETDSAPITLYSGWNLIGIYGTNVKSYTAKTLIQDINADDFTADNVTEWAKDKQMYEGFQLSDGEEYGFDFPLNKLESYFVRITQGSGNWQPELSSNN